LYLEKEPKSFLF